MIENPDECMHYARLSEDPSVFCYPPLSCGYSELAGPEKVTSSPRSYLPSLGLCSLTYLSSNPCSATVWLEGLV